jgi:hypothetical protein
MPRSTLLKLLILPIPFNFGWAQAVTGTPNLESIVSRMVEARTQNRARRQPLRVVRNYRLFGKERQTAKSEVTAYIDYVPPDVQSFTFHKEYGSGLGEVIVHKILENEKDVLADQGASDISPANYAFRYAGEEIRDAKPCFVLDLMPLRKDSKLLSGKAWIDQKSYLIVRLEGEPAQAPSWWVHNIHLTLDFTVVHGMWVQSALQSTANVRLLGPHTITAHDVEYSAGDLAASLAVQRIAAQPKR